MEKVVYAVWRGAAEPRGVFNARLREEIAPLLAKSCRAVRLNLQDEAVADCRTPRMSSTRPQMEAFVQLWVDSAGDGARQPIDSLLGEASARIAGWLVCESTPLRNVLHPPVEGRRTEGFAQMALLGRPPRLTHEAWRQIWQRDHTAVAIETQSTFEYVQNLVVRPLTYGAPDYAAIVEECFPPAAMTDEATYFDAVGETERMSAHQARMGESCARFIDFDRIDCMPTSQFEVRRLGG